MVLAKEVIVALDFATGEEALAFLDLFQGQSLFVKVGLELYLQAGAPLVQQIKASGHRIFLDLKLHDIPNTVYRAAKGLANLQVDLLTVHAAGGSRMLQAAKRGLAEGGAERTQVLAVTQLTSTSQAQMQQEQLIAVSLAESVRHYAQLAQQAGVDGVVCSVQEVSDLASCLAPTFLKVTPGIRLATSPQDDQARIATPEQAATAGSTHIVVGRPITQASNPVEAYQQIKYAFLGGKL